MAKFGVYEVIELDVWGNFEEGFDVNDCFHTGKNVVLDFEDDANIINALILAGIFTNLADEETVYIDGDGYCLYLEDAESGRPLINLEFVELA